ncbi:hypothetical protein [Magnetospirillum aberrantis]|uniref:MmcB family DNA repair protein n=1 Tax=Magnetospirillum aberrantis SpK TaxID=908842 RepID=A0A7C9QTM6_9PROT|nr:hypothetical protein [Magnetospirillum aberrantis]NFV80017.1 hypothetical protein [Magnetospirillum aberrantis SpK]
MRTADVKAALRRAYPAPEYAILFEVADATGARHSRFADAVAMSLWPSRGLTVDGFEIKVSRSDWLREKAKPEKAETIARFCDYWWLVVPKGLVKVEELPATWGLKEVSEAGEVRTAKSPEKLNAQPLDRLFVASMLRNAGKVDDEEVQTRVNALLGDRVEREVERRLRFHESSKPRYEKLDALIQELKNDGEWFGDEEVLDAVRMVLKSGVLRSYGGLISVHKSLTEMADHIGKAMGVLNMPEPGKKRGRA